MRCLQANLHHAKAATTELSRRLAGGINIGLIQEPWIYRGRPQGLNVQNTQVIYDKSAVKPRAAIIIDTNIKFLPFTEFMDGDTSTILVEAESGGSKREVVIASAYFPGDADIVPPEKIRGLVEYCQTHNQTLVIGCDANSHNVAWGSTNTNNRGESLLEFLLLSNITIVNRGNKPTFVNAIRQEVLDLTLITNKSLNMISNWRVSDEDSMSDHKHILFDLNGVVKFSTFYRSPKTANWKRYNECLSAKLNNSVSKITSTEELEKAVTDMTDSIIASYQDCCPLKMKSSKKRGPGGTTNLTNFGKQRINYSTLQRKQINGTSIGNP